MKNLKFILFVIIGLILVVVSGAVYTVDETQKAVLTQFGEPIGGPIETAGLRFKIPFIQKVTYFDKRILNWDGDSKEIQTLEKRYIWVDTTARWRISDALTFMQSVWTENSAQARLDDVIDGATRDVIANYVQIEALRNSNRLLEQVNVPVSEDDFQADKVFVPIKVGREEISRKILEQASKIVERYGIELVDVRIKRINYIPDVREKVYERMVSERNAAAARYRSEGKGRQAEIEGEMIKELEKIQSEAYKTSQEIKGKADAEAAKIYADAFNKDAEFYGFVKTLETYKKTVNEDNILIFSTENEFFKELNSSRIIQ